MKNILLPTNLSVASLYPIHEICKRANGELCNIYLVHTLQTPTGIIELLNVRDREPYKKLPANFTEAIEMLKKKYAGVINKLSFDFLYYNSRHYLINYIHARDIQSVYILADYNYQGGTKKSVDCVKVLHKCGVPVTAVNKAAREEVGTYTTILYKEKMSA